MLKNYIITNIRALWKNKSHALINMLGLALGITCAILIFLIVRFELSFDNYHENKERIYRIITEYTRNETPGYTAGITYPLPPAIRNDFADPEYVTIVDANHSDPVITITHRDGSTDRFKEKKVIFADSSYFKIFKHEWIEGNTDALAQPKTAVLTESVAKKYFGSESPIGKVLNYDNDFDVTVTGVIKDPPANTDFRFSIILSSNIGTKRGWEDWGATSSSINCYIKLHDGISEKDFEAKLKGWHLKYFTGENQQDGIDRNYQIQPLREVHFDTRFHNFGSRTISYVTLLTLGAIGALLLLTACINFVNLNTVLIINRSKEAGIRKVMGSTRAQLIWQFLGETFIVTVLALLISTGLAELALIYLTPVLGYRLEFKPLTDIITILFLTLLPIIVTLLSGLYPGLTLSRFQPVKALKSKISGTPGQGLTLRRGLIVFQLMISQILVICTIVVVQQINYFMSQPLGLNSEAVIEFELPENKPEVIHRLRDRLLTIAGVEHVTMSNTGSTSENSWGGDFKAVVNGKLVQENTNVKYANEDYVETFGLTLLHGEDLIRSDSATRFLVNEKFTKALGFENPRDALGTTVEMWGVTAPIMGVIKDFNANSLKQRLTPVIIMNGTTASYVGAVRLNTKNANALIPEVQKVWEEVYPKYVFEYSFLDQTIANFYEAERRSGYLIGVFASVAIFIGCIGLFGLVSFMARSKTKEVGIRKTLGATVGQVVVLFSKEFIILILISFAISAPLAYYFSEEWLENFAYRKHPDAITFFIGVVVSLLVVLGTVGFKSYRAATANPVNALRDE